MNCFYHIMVPAVAQCKNCGKFLCRECATRYPDMICEDCAYAMQDQEHRKVIRRNHWALCIFVIAVISIFEEMWGLFPVWQVISIAIGGGWFCAGIPFGWYALRQFRLPDNIIMINLVLLIILGGIKIIGSIIIGWFVLLVYLFKSLLSIVNRW